MSSIDVRVACALRSIHPPPGFDCRLRTSLRDAASRPHGVSEIEQSSRTKLYVACGLAGVVSVTGVAFLGARMRHRGRRAA